MEHRRLRLLTHEKQQQKPSCGCSRDGTKRFPLVQRVQKMVEVPQIQFIDKLVDALVSMQRQISEQEHIDATASLV